MSLLKGIRAAPEPESLFPRDHVGAARIEPRRPFRFDDNCRRDLLDDGGPLDRGAGAELRAVVNRRVDRFASGRENRFASPDDCFRGWYALLHARRLRLVDMSVERALDVHDLDRVMRLRVG